LVATVLVGSQVLANTGVTTPRLEPPVPAASSNAPDDEDEGDDHGDGGNAHSRAVHAWVTCKAVKGKEACVKPAPPGKALGHDHHGWGRAHAPGQLKTKHKGDDEDTDDPTS
jgi:hypothetical protein